jgi:hypothetical protein
MRMVCLLAIRGIAVGAGLSGVFVLMAHVRLGGQSPGASAIAAIALRTWIPLMFGVIGLWFLWTCSRIVLSARQQASSAGIPLLQYLDLPDEQKSRLLTGSHAVK